MHVDNPCGRRFARGSRPFFNVRIHAHAQYYYESIRVPRKLLRSTRQPGRDLC